MRKYLLPKDGNFYKANLHCHTTVSDGRRTPEEVKELYKSKGYSIVAYTDHDVMIEHPELDDESFLALTGYEMEMTETNAANPAEKKTAHVCLVALSRDIKRQVCWHREKYVIGRGADYRHLVRFDENEPDYERTYTHECISDIMRRGRENGFFVTYNHPTWSNETYPNYIGYHGMHAMEIFNGSCIVGGYEDINPRVYDDMLRAGERIYAIGADDNHNARPDDSRRSDSGVAWTVIKAPSLAYTDITDALVQGHFYASLGPEIKELYYEEGKIYITTSPADRIIMNTGARRRGVAYREKGRSLTKTSFTVPEDAVYVRITVIDKSGMRADTSAYFIDELKRN